MVIHKRTKLTPFQREALYKDRYTHRMRLCDLILKYHVSAPTVYKIVKRGQHNDFSIHSSTNHRFRCLKFGIKRLSKIERAIQERLKKQAKRYNKDYPGQMVHFDCRRLPLLEGQLAQTQRDYLFIAIDDFSRELFAAILPDKTQYSSKQFLDQVLEECAYSIEQSYSDNGKEFKGDPDHHAFMLSCKKQQIEQRFTRVRNPKTNGKAERVIRTIMEMWHEKTRFSSSAHRKTELIRFVNFYNTVKPHASLDGLTPLEKLIDYFYPETINNA